MMEALSAPLNTPLHSAKSWQLFADQVSGARDDRPGLQQALAYVQPGACLIVWKPDRLGRSLPHLLQIVTTLHTQGVAFRSLTEQMDTTRPHVQTGDE